MVVAIYRFLLIVLVAACLFFAFNAYVATVAFREGLTLGGSDQMGEVIAALVAAMLMTLELVGLVVYKAVTGFTDWIAKHLL